MAFFGELRRRKVWRTAGVYATTALATALAVAELYEHVGLPDRTPTVVIILLSLGFPVVLALAWVYDLRREDSETAGPADHALPVESGRGTAKRSIAVLPFVNLSHQGEDEYFSDGMTEEVISALANLPDLRVIARTSAFTFKGSDQDVRQIGRALGVETVLEGSVRRSDDRLRITAQLVDVAGGHHIWSQRYDRELADVFEIQDEIAQIIARRLGPNERSTQRRAAPTDNLKAYQAYLRGMFFYWQYSVESAGRALTCFEDALSHDPEYALAHAGAALSHTWLAGFGDETRESTPERARASARKALELSPDLTEGLLGLAEVLFYLDWDFAGAERAVLRAIEQSPSSVHAQGLYGFCLRRRGQLDQAVTQFEKAIHLDPLSVPMHNELGNAYLAAGRSEEAEAQIKRTLDLDSEFVPALETLGWLHVRAGGLEEGLRVFQTLPRGRSSTLAALGFTLALLGRLDEARDQLSQLETSSGRRPADQVNIARVYAGLGEFDQTVRHLERAIEARVIPAILWDRSVRDWGTFREDPRFQLLVDRVEHATSPRS